MDYAIEVNRRAEEEDARRERYRKKQEIAKLKRIMGACQQKLEEITRGNASLLSNNGDQLLISEIRRLEGEIGELTKGL